MDALQLHLFFNHVPLIGTFAALLVVIIGAILRNHAIRMSGLAVYVVMALAVVPTYLTGEEAEEKVEHISGINKDSIEEHEDMANISLWLMLATAAVGAGAFVAQWKSAKPSITSTLSIVFIIIATAAFIQVGITAHEGGQIRRPDLGAPSVPDSSENTETPSTEDKD